MITREQLERQMAEFRARMVSKPIARTIDLPPVHAEVDEHGVSAELRALLAEQARQS
jgi:hypothetical protein